MSKVIDNIEDINAIDLKAPLASPTFTGTVGGITKAMVGLGSVDNTADTAKPISTATQTALNLKANLTNAMIIDSADRVTMPYQPAFCVSGLSGTYVGPCTFPFNAFALGIPSQKSINFNTSNGVFTAPISGLYQFNLNIYNHNVSDVAYAVFKNGSALVPSDWFQRQSGTVTMTTWSFALYLNLNDYIQMGLRGGTVNVYSGHTYFSGYLIG
jgi:hypothetical protein